MVNNEQPESKLFRRWKNSLFFTITFAILNSTIYSYMARVTMRRAQIATLLRLPLESKIPLVPAAIWIYVSFWPLLIIPFWIYSLPKQFQISKILVRFFRQKLGLHGKTSWFFANLVIKLLSAIESVTRFIFGEEDDEKIIRKARIQIFLSYVVISVVSGFIYWLTPFVLPRTHLGIEKLPGLTIRMLSFVWRTDLPDNTFPSQHASFSFLIFFIFNHLRPEPHLIGIKNYLTSRSRKMSVVGLIFFLWAAAIVLSTFFVKQHLLMDAIAGISLSYIAFRIGFSDKLYGLVDGKVINPVMMFFKKVFRPE